MKAEPTIQFDPTFSYYLDRSPESVAAELELAGYRTVRYFVTDETRVNRRLVEAMKDRGLEVWGMVLGNGYYSTNHLPPDWPSWQMTLLKPVNDGFTRLSPFSSRYVAWKKAALAQIVRTVPFDGIEIAESYFPEWNGLSSGVYGDVGPLARAAFKKFSGGEMPEFKYRTSPYYYKKDIARYMLWVEFRVQTVNGFLHELLNGAGGAREANPRLRVATWSVAVDARNAVSRVREEQGFDAPEMIRRVRPDLHIIQTHWPDWMRGKLPADYAKAYASFVEQIRASHPSLPLGLQTDIGSLRNMRRSRGWLTEFAAEAGRLGYSMWTAYEYHIGLTMYTEPPVPLAACRIGSDRIRLDFSKRVDEATAAAAERYTCFARDERLALALTVEKIDGNQVTLRTDGKPGFPPESFHVQVHGIRDTPDRRLLPKEPYNESPPGSSVTVPAAL
ncbi:N-acyl-D-glucosamine 2-epimerase [Paenibacillus filicis]|uniref:N-acyl-D-glucosamine 2-epimerase n=1 Tax=Paenibacillus gyeongsangnamensis TaxID=3388067 RepID=A0ABT4QGL7_9BACL|nr:N-acyl-D-glucosamine 2-epimerase [Paenibacillus filicis]MCZ8515953.1 N-acyl-D-glucosamine 2-epimerase [Paenibacillus filicis]